MLVAQLSMAGVAPALARYVAQGDDDEQRLSRARAASAMLLTVTGALALLYPLAVGVGIAPASSPSIVWGTALAFIYAYYYGVKIVLFSLDQIRRYAVYEFTADAVFVCVIVVASSVAPDEALAAFPIAYALFLAVALSRMRVRGGLRESGKSSFWSGALSGYAALSFIATFGFVARMPVITVVSGLSRSSQVAGHIAAIMALTVPLYLIPQAAGMVTFARIARSVPGTSGVGIARTTVRVAVISSALVALFIVAAPRAVPLLLGGRGRPFVGELVLICASSVLQLASIPATNAISAEGRVRVTAGISLTGLALTLLLAVFLVPIWGVWGAAVALSTATLVTGGLALAYARRMFGLSLGVVATSSAFAGVFAATEIAHPLGVLAGAALWVCGLGVMCLVLAVLRLKLRASTSPGLQRLDAAGPIRSVVISHMSSDENIGDYAILHAIATQVRARCEPEQITVLSAEIPAKSSAPFRGTHRMEALGLEVLGTPVPSAACWEGGRTSWLMRLVRAEVALRCFRLGWRRIGARMLGNSMRLVVSRIEGADLIIAKGGSYLFGGPGLRDQLFVWRMTYYLRLCAALGKPVVPFGISVGPLPRLAARHVAAALESSPRIYVRESLSADYLRDRMRVDDSSVMEIPDPALGLVAEGQSVASLAAAGPRGIAFTVRELPALANKPTLDTRRRFREAVTDCALHLSERYSVSFIVQVAEDARLSESIAADVPGANVVDATALDRLDDVIALYSSYELLVGTRLHSVLLAAVGATPAIHLAYEHHKGVGLMETLGAGAWTVPTDEVDGLGLSLLVEDALRQRDELSLRLRGRVTHARARLDVAYNGLCPARVLSDYDRESFRAGLKGHARPARVAGA